MLLLIVALCCGPLAVQGATTLADTFENAVKRVNEEHARKPGTTKEADLGKRVPKEARQALERLLKLKPAPDLEQPLWRCAEAALDLDLGDDFAHLRAQLALVSAGAAKRLGIVVSRPRFLLRGTDGVTEAWLAHFADVLDAVLDAYDDVFGFAEWSKVPGKKLRVRAHLVAEITAPPHFAPELPYHSEVDFPVADTSTFASPTKDGKFLLYGLCHELGHVIAMWGDAKHQEDHHSWAHYTGVAIVEQVIKRADPRVDRTQVGDAQWRSLDLERKRLEPHAVALDDADGVLTLLIRLHDRIGGRAIGAALNALDQQDKRLRVNRVRYYTFTQLKVALLDGAKDAATRKAIAGIFGSA
ncbi:MAG: hypothetical protein U1E76_06695 [Planctomycetota bacterium]